MYPTKLLKILKRNYTTIERETLALVYALHKFKHYLLGNRFTLFVNHVVLVYLTSHKFFASLLDGFYYLWNMISRSFINLVDLT
jgi:hypothetical protein